MDADLDFIIGPDRSKVTLQPLIKRVAADGTIIYSDEWASYADLDQIGYHHETVNHSVVFVSPEGVHINTTESLHNEMKLELKRSFRASPTCIPERICLPKSDVKQGYVPKFHQCYQGHLSSIFSPSLLEPPTPHFVQTNTP